MKFPQSYPVACHTDQVGAGSTFVVIRGYAQHGGNYIATALQKGARKIVVDQPLTAQMRALIINAGVLIVQVMDARTALAELSARASSYAHKKLKIIGITGTKGKTTSAALLFHMLAQSGRKAALLSTVYNAIGSHRFNASLTTPQPDYLHQFFKTAVDAGVEWVVMEVAAQAISLRRIERLQFDAVIMLNIAREHLEFYDSMDQYAHAKLKLLNYRKANAPAWLNADDERLAKVKGDTIHRFSIEHSGELSAQLRNKKGFSLDALFQHNDAQYEISCPQLCGEYSLYNLLASSAGALTAGLSWPEITDSVKTFAGVPGRFEQYQLSNGARAFIDYAHNPLSYEALFKAVRDQTDHLIVLFGAGGERDPGRRPEMGRIAAEYADLVILTTDNPRSEDPKKIIEDILKGVPAAHRSKMVIELDRKAAIVNAYKQSRPGSIIALLGKGPDEYQLVQGIKTPFSERAILQSL